MAWTKKGQRLLLLGVDTIRPNPHQPRKNFDDAALKELCESIRQNGVLQPLCVRKGESGWVLIAGERRLRAAKMAGLREVPCLAVKAEEEEGAVLAIIENIQRSNLHFLEEAEAMASLIRLHGLSQEEAARRVGKSQGAVANKLRLLQLSPACREALISYQLTERHGRCALRLAGERERLDALLHMGQKGWTVRQSEEYIEKLLAEKKEKTKPRRSYVLKDVRLFFNSLERSLGLMRQSGIAAEGEKREEGEETVVTIRIPRKKVQEKGQVLSNCN